jgi:hypothetical protein
MLKAIRVDRELKQFALVEKKSQLINVAQFEPEWAHMVGVFRAEMLRRDDELKAHIDKLYGIDLGLQVLNDYTFAALIHLAQHENDNPGHDHPHDASISVT